MAFIPSLFAEEAAHERSVTSLQNAAGSQIIINEVNLDLFPTVQLFAIDLKPVEQNQTEVSIQIQQK